MELASVNVAALDRCGQLGTVFGSRRRTVFTIGGIVGMDKINAVALVQIFEQLARLFDDQRVPSDMRDLQIGRNNFGDGSDRAGDDIHASDTRQELMSLAARFGLTVTFSVPDRDKFLYIVRELAKQYGLSMSEQELSVRAEASALRAGGRSARAAKQFVELCAAGVLHSDGEW